MYLARRFDVALFVLSDGAAEMTDENDFRYDDAFQREAQRNEELRKQEKMRELDFGLSVQRFLDGPIGQRILEDAEAELKDISNALFEKNVDDESDRSSIRNLLARAAVLRHWQDAFANYIISGQNAEKELEQLD